MKKTLSLLLCLLLALSLCACGGAKNASSAPQAAPAEMPMADEVYWEADESEEYGGFAMTEAMPEPAAAAGDAGEAPAEVSSGGLDPEKIIYSASATVETTEFEQTLEKLQELVRQMGGFVESSSINGSNFYSQSRGYAASRSANFTLRIPSARFSELMGSLSTLGNIPYTYTYTENITSQYYDVRARLTAYQTQEQRLLEMMEKAETVSDVIEIEDRLTELRYRIESLQSTLNNYDRQVSFSTVSVNVSEVTVYTPEAQLTYGQQLALAARNGLRSALDFLRGALLWLLEALPMLVILGLIALLLVIVVRRRIRQRKAAKAADAGKKE